jgi:hypothetical protein
MMMIFNNFIELIRYVFLHCVQLQPIFKKYGCIAASLWKNYLRGLVSPFFNARLYQILSIVFIYVFVQPIDWSLCIDPLRDSILNLELLPSQTKIYQVRDLNIKFSYGYSYRSLPWIKIFIFIFIIIKFSLVFIIQNYIFIISSLLSAILIKALALNFYNKHFKYYYDYIFAPTGIASPSDKWKKLVYLVRQIVNNIYKIIKHLLKIWIISVILIFTFRSMIATMLLNLENKSLSIILTLVLPLPMILYLLNFIIKYLKKEPIKDEDYYLYNDYVVERVNLYRITYITFVNYLIRNYYSTISIVIMTIVLIVLFIALLIICKLYVHSRQTYKGASSRQSTISGISRCRVINNNEPLALKSAFQTTAGYISAFIAITPFFQEGCNKGFMDYYINTGKTKYYDWKRITFPKPRVIKKGLTVNIMENIQDKNKKDRENMLYIQDESTQKNLIANYKPQIEKSPILNMSWKLKYNEGIQRSKEKFTVKPINYFTNPEYYGSVNLVLQGRFLIVLLIRRDSPGCVFMPTYCLPADKNDSKSFTQIRDTVNLLEHKYGIVMPRIGWEKANNRSNGLVIYTQGESIENKSLFKVWRPTLNYTEPELKTVENYYYWEEPRLRCKEFITKDFIKLKEKINAAVKVQQNYLDRLLRDDVKLSKEMQKSFMERLAHIEHIVDRYYQELVKFYILKGVKANPNFTVNYDDDKGRLGYENLKILARRETEESIIREKSINPDKKEREQTTGELLELVKAKFDRFNSNNEYMDNTLYYFKTRRDYPIHSVLFSHDKRHLTLFSIYKNGVIEGYKEKSQTLGKLSSSLKLPLVESRIQLIKNMANHSREFEDFDNFYGVSINRLTFEFFELISTNSIYFGISERDGTSQQLLDENSDCEVYSIIDIKNNSLQLPVVFNENESYKLTIPKYDYNLLDNTDEHTIRRFMDFVYHENLDGYLTYDSNEVNSIATGKWDSNEANSITRGKKDSSEVNSVAKGKRVHFSKEDIDHKKGKIQGKYYRKVRFTKEAVDYKKGKKPGKYNYEISQGAEERVGKTKEIREKDRQLALQKGLQGKKVKINNEVQVKLLVKDSVVSEEPLHKGKKNIPKSILKKSTNDYPKRRVRAMPAPQEPINSPPPQEPINSPPPQEPINSPPQHTGEKNMPKSILKKPTDHFPKYILNKSMDHPKYILDKNKSLIKKYTERYPKPNLKKSTDHYPKRKPRMMLPTEKPIPPLPKKRKAIALLPTEEPINTPNPPKRLRAIALLPPEEPSNAPTLPKGGVSAFPAPQEPINSPELAIKPPIDTSAWLVPDDEDIYGYSGDEDNTKNNNGGAVKVSAAQNNSGAAVEVSAVQEVDYPLVQPMQDSPGYTPYSEEAESLANNDNNMDWHSTGEALGAGQVNESEVSLISADDISRDYISRDGAPSPQFFIPEPSEDNISSMSYSPKYTEANLEQAGQILEPNLLNREEEALPAAEIDANLAREVMMNSSLGNQAVVETIDPSLLLPSQLISIQAINPEPVEAEDSPLSSIGDEELYKLEQEVSNGEELSPSMEEEASGKEEGSTPSGKEDAAGDEDSSLSNIGDEELSKLEQEIFNREELVPLKEEEVSGKTLDPFIPPAVVEVRDPEVIIISSDDSSSEDTSSPPAPGEVGDPEAIIISSDDSSSEASPEAYDENLRYVAEAIDRERGYKYLTVAIDRMLAVMTPIGSGIEPRLVGVDNNRCYCVEMTIDTNYRVFPWDIPEVPDLHVNHHEVTLYLPPGVDSVNLSDAAEGYPDGIENLPEGDPENPVYYFNFFELVNLEDYIDPDNLEGSNDLERSNNIERSSFSFSEPIEDKEVVNSPNISLNNYNNEGSPLNSEEIVSRISSSAFQAREVNMSEDSNSGEAVHSTYSDKRGSFGPPGRADNFSSGESEVSLISADDISRDYISREGAPSPDGMEIDGDNPSISSPNIEGGQDKSMDIDDNSSHPENPEDNAQYDTRMEDIDKVNQEGLVDGYSSLDFDPCGVSTDFFGYSYDGDMIIRSTQETLNIQARYEDWVNNSQVSSPLGGDTEGGRLPIINPSYQRGESVDDRSRTEVAITGLSDRQANQEQTGQILESNLLNREEEALPAAEIDANLAREVMMNSSLGNQAVVETIDPSLLLPSQLIPIQAINPEPVEAEDSSLSSIGDEELYKLEQEVSNREELSPSMEEESEDSPLSSIGDREMSELEREFNPNPSSEVEAAVETRYPSLLLPSQLISIQPINSEPVGYLELLQSSIREREFNPNPSSEVEAVPVGDIDASGDEIASGEEYGSPEEGAPYGVVTIHIAEAVSQDVDASGDEIASGEEYGSPEEGAPWGTFTIRASGDVDTSGVVDPPEEEDAPECRRTRRGMRLRSGRLI